MEFFRRFLRRRPCDLCHGTGVIEFRATGQQFPCNGCLGSGKARRVILGFTLLALCALALPQTAQAQSCVASAQVTLTGTLRSSNGLPSSNYTITLTPSQQGFIAGCGINVQTPNTCATSTDGSVVGIPNPLTATVNTVGGSGALPAGTYYSVIAFYDANGNVTLVSPETRTVVSSTSALVVNPPSSGVPSTASGMNVYIGTASGGETLQGQTVGSASFTQSTALSAGTAMPTANTTQCKLVANDAIWPVGTGYVVSMVDSNGNGIPGYPMQWQLMGAGTTINLSNGLPYYHGVVMYPSPILASPLNHALQSISGSLSLSGYNLTNVGKIGFGTSTPGWPIDVENGAINASGGYLINGAAGSAGQCAATDGTAIDEFVNCVTSLPTLYYQTVDSNGTAMTQRSALNFSSDFSLTDSASPTETTVGLGNSGATAGSYTNPNMTVDAKGRVTAISNGTPPGGLDEYWNVAGCSFPTDNNGSSCTLAMTLPTAFADANYWVFCQAYDAATSPGSWGYTVVKDGSKTTTGFTLTLIEDWGNTAGAGNSWPEIDCHAHHD